MTKRGGSLALFSEDRTRRSRADHFVLWLARDTRSGARTNHLTGSKSRSCVDRIESGGIAAGRLI
jgi:hypothetical protein